MTERERMTLDYIDDFIRRRGYSPSFRQIANKIGITSTSRVASIVDQLERQGLVRRNPRGRARNLEIVKPDIDEAMRHLVDLFGPDEVWKAASRATFRRSVAA